MSGHRPGSQLSIAEPQDFLTMGTMEMAPCSAEAIFIYCSNFHPLLCLLCTLSSLISLSSDNYHVNPEPELPELPDHPEAWEWWSLSQLSHSAPGIQGSLLHIHKMEACISNIRIPPQQDWFAWTAVVSSKHVYPALEPHITRYVGLNDHSPSGATWSFIISLVTLIHLSSSLAALGMHFADLLILWVQCCWLFAASQCSVRTDLLAHFTPFMFKIAAVFSSLTFNWRQNVPVMRIFITSTLLSLGQGSQENFLMSAETN